MQTQKNYARSQDSTTFTFISSVLSPIHLDPIGCTKNNKDKQEIEIAFYFILVNYPRQFEPLWVFNEVPNVSITTLFWDQPWPRLLMRYVIKGQKRILLQCVFLWYLSRVIKVLQMVPQILLNMSWIHMERISEGGRDFKTLS